MSRETVRRQSTRLMSANTKGGQSPTGHGAGGKGSGLGPAADRMTTAIRRANAQGVTLLGGQEVSGVQVSRVIERHPLWMPLVATPNEHFRHGATLGNVAFLFAPEWTLEEHSEIECPTSVGPLHFVDAIVRHRLTGTAVRWITGHQPAGRRVRARKDRAACEADVRAAIQGEKLPIFLTFDFNTPNAFRGWAGARHGIDAALVRGLPTSKPRTHMGFHGAVSDHAAVSTEVYLGRPL